MQRSERTDPGPGPEEHAYPAVGSNDPHFERQGVTAEDEDGIGHGEEGFVAADYPGQNRLTSESREAARARLRRAWHGPDVDATPDERAAEGVRADERILDELCWRLSKLDLDCGALEARVHERHVFLAGSLSDEHTRQTVEETAANIHGVETLESRLRAR